MKLCAQQARGNAAALRCFSLLALAGLGSAAAAKKTTDIDTSTLLLPSVSTASGDYIHASVVSVADDDASGNAGLTTLTLQCVNGGSACANSAFAGKTYVYGPATASVALDHSWSCAVSTATASPSTVCAYSDATPSTTTVAGAAWNTAVTITSGVDKLRAKKTQTTASSPTATDGSGLCKRVTKGHGADDDAGSDSVGSTTPKSGDASDDDANGSSSGSSTKNPCSGASRWGLDTSLMGAMAVISGLGLVILGL
ncbi:hypothetical protein SLS62_004007 [Diatrype stigma]|uniref:Uncharacterized protein n=1 Tax=Diatrype stigma TaxID=117547 RepID=A0AAN9UX90_9PEZI